MQRRNFVQLGSSLFTLPFLTGAAKVNPHASRKKLSQGEKSVVFVMLNGGNSHIDFTHANPNAIQGMQAVNGSIETKTPGLFLGADFQKLASISNKLNVVHSYSHNNNNHFNAQCVQVSGKKSIGNDQMEPGYGAYISKIYGPSNEINGLPLYLQAAKSSGLDGAWLGSAYNPYDANNKKTDDLVLKLSPERFGQRLKILDVIDKNLVLRDEQLKTMNKLRMQAVNMIAGNLKEVFDIKQEKQTVRDEYGMNTFGDSLLLARRLLEAGGKFVHAGLGSWDMHQNISDGFKRQGPQLDQALAAFITDLETRGMLENTLVIVAGDFGRTPKINAQSGRDHWGSLCSLIFAGGKNEYGRLIGKADRLMTIPDENPIKPQDVAKTIFDHFGVVNTQFTTLEGRPMWIYDKEAKNILT